MAEEVNLFIAFVIGIVGALIGSIGIMISTKYQNKRWAFKKASNIRTKDILSAYKHFARAFIRINHGANVGTDKTRFTFDEIRQSLDDFHLSLLRMEIWLNEENRGKMRENLGILRELTDAIWIAQGAKPSIDADLWLRFSKIMDSVKQVVREEMRTEDLREFYMQP